MPIQVELHDSSSELDSLDPLLPINLQPFSCHVAKFDFNWKVHALVITLLCMANIIFSSTF